MTESQVPQFDTVLFERTGRILWLTLNRPEKLNAVNTQMHDDFEAALEFAGEDDDSDVVVLTGAGRGFCAGGDVAGQAASETGTNVRMKPAQVHSAGRRVIDKMLWVEKPLIAMVNGPAVGLGATIALFCDIVVMANEATIGDRHVNVGLVAGDGGAVIWPLLVGPSKAKEFLMTGRLLSGAEAERHGLVSHAVPLDSLRETTEELARELIGLPQYAMRATKSAVNRQVRDQAERILDVSLALEWLSMSTAEHKEAVQKFVQSRKSSAR